MSSAAEFMETAPPEDRPASKTSLRRRGRRMGGGASLVAQGEPMVWLTGGALVIALAMIFGLLGYIFFKGTQTFWPGALRQVTLLDGTVYLGEVARDDWYRPSAQSLAQMPPDRRAAAQAEVAARDGRVHRRLLRIENFELTGSHFHWIDDYAVAAERQPKWAMLVERTEIGRFYGYPTAIVIDGEKLADASGLEGARLDAARERVWKLYHEYHDATRARRARIESLKEHDLGEQSRRLENARLAVRQAELDDGKPSPAWREAEAAYERTKAEVEKQYARINEQIAEIAAENQKYQITFTTVGGASETFGLAEIVRMFPPNQLTWADKWGVYFSRWVEFLTADPREANSAGGVWPAIVGTVTMTLLLAVAVVPFGVLAALYLREYAKSGPIVSAVRIAINNLAGVPSIVFGVFGLGFFCYIVGGGIDQIFFEAKAAEGNPTYGKGALIWAALTLALLTLPVVIVAAEEALAAVPNSMREGSYACGAGKWQTIRRIVLPHAMPGIMTGMILAMARGAGEVAPLMLVGAVKIAYKLPIDATAPFIHPDRSFMHLGFHIFDLGFHSQNSEAAKPMVFTTTLLLIALIAVLNLLAVWLRSRLRKRFAAGQF